VRVTFMSGDVHVGAYGCFQAHPKQHLRVVDPKFMMQVGWDNRACCVWVVCLECGCGCGGPQVRDAGGWDNTEICVRDGF
jgi:hypothetical protein